MTKWRSESLRKSKDFALFPQRDFTYYTVATDENVAVSYEVVTQVIQTFAVGPRSSGSSARIGPVSVS